MADVAKYQPINGGSLNSDLRSVISMVKTRRTVAFAYVCMFAFVIFTLFLAFNPSPSPSSPWFSNIFSSGSDSRFSSAFDYFFPKNASDHENPNFTLQPAPQPAGSVPSPKPTVEGSGKSGEGLVLKQNQTDPFGSDLTNRTSDAKIDDPFAPAAQNRTIEKISSSTSNITVNSSSKAPSTVPPPAQSVATNGSSSRGPKSGSSQSSPVNGSEKTHESDLPPVQSGSVNGSEKTPESDMPDLETLAPAKRQSNGGDGSVESLMNCDLFDGDWIVDDSYPLYKPGSCSLIDEQFSCISNGRPDKDYQKYKWKPNGCSIPRLDAKRLLEMLKGKRLVFVGDSLNRNMWESMVCILRSAAKDPSKVFEAHGRHHFRGEAEYSFVFRDYNFTVEFYVSPFLVQEWEIKDKAGTAKERLRLDLIGKTCDDYKGADILIFNTGHWWTHEKTSLGKDYYQEGSHVYPQLNVLEAFHRALTTWAKWVDANVDPNKSIVFFRGYSASHFSGGQWNSGGACDSETEPIKNHTYLTPYPPKMKVLEDVLNGMKTHVSYLNITRLTDYRKDGHPSIYRKKIVPEKERKSPMRYQDCSHWCLPGVPDVWNELLYAELLVREHQKKILK